MSLRGLFRALAAVLEGPGAEPAWRARRGRTEGTLLIPRAELRASFTPPHRTTFFLSMMLKLTGQLKGPDIYKFAPLGVHPIYLGISSHLQPLRLGD